jgi:hypothetical protein
MRCLLTRFCALSLALLLLPACGGDADSPEQRIAALVDRLEQAVEQRDSDPVREALLPDYSDNRYRDRSQAIAALRAYLYLHRGLNLFTVVRDIRLEADQARASAVVYVALTAVPVASVSELVSVKADAARFDVRLVADGDDWRVAGADWRRVGVDDFL